MPTNKFFNNYYFNPEQDLLESLVDEACNMYGMDVYYIPRNISNFDKLYETDDQSTYTNAIPAVIYMQNIEGFDGQQNIFTKFALEIRNSITVVMSNREFIREVEPVLIASRPTATRPDEGDLIFFPLNHACFVIRYVNNKELFYPLGRLPSYQMSCDLFEYSDETFNTGIADIDRIQKQKSLNALDYQLDTETSNALVSESGAIITGENYDTQNIDIIADNDFLNLQANNLIDYSGSNPFGSIPDNS